MIKALERLYGSIMAYVTLSFVLMYLFITSPFILIYDALKPRKKKYVHSYSK